MIFFEKLWLRHAKYPSMQMLYMPSVWTIIQALCHPKLEPKNHKLQTNPWHPEEDRATQQSQDTRKTNKALISNSACWNIVHAFQKILSGIPLGRQTVWIQIRLRGQKFHLFAHNYKWNLEIEGGVIHPRARITQGSHITPLCSLLHTPLNDKCMCMQDKWKL